MSDDRPFIEAILANPADDAPRLTYADWLDGADGPHERIDHDRAEFIRVQMALAPLTHPGGKRVRRALAGERRKRYDALKLREAELLGAHAWFWAGAVFHQEDDHRGREWTRKWVTAGAYRRGFLEEIGCTTADFLAYGEALLAVQPVTLVNLSDPRLPRDVLLHIRPGEIPPLVGARVFRVRYQDGDRLWDQTVVITKEEQRLDRSGVWRYRLRGALAALVERFTDFDPDHPLDLPPA